MRRILDPSMGLENGPHSNSNEFLRITTGNKMPGLEMSSSSRNSVEHYKRLLSKVPILHLVQVVRDRLVNNPSQSCMFFMHYNQYLN